MNRATQSVLVLLVGGSLLRITVFSDVYLRYVKAGLQWPLAITGALLVCTATVTLLGELYGSRAQDVADEHAVLTHDGITHGHGHGHDDGHGHGHGGPTVAWLLVLPVAAIMLIGPPALGSYTVERAGAAEALQPAADYPALTGTDPVALSLREYVDRALWAEGKTLYGRTVRLTGFITSSSDQTYLTRIAISCCAADGQALRLRLTGPVPSGLTPDTWTTVTGRYDGKQATDPVSDETIPTLTVRTLERVPAPSEPYDG